MMLFHSFRSFACLNPLVFFYLSAFRSALVLPLRYNFLVLFFSIPFLIRIDVENMDITMFQLLWLTLPQDLSDQTEHKAFIGGKRNLFHLKYGSTLLLLLLLLLTPFLALALTLFIFSFRLRVFFSHFF